MAAGCIHIDCYPGREPPATIRIERPVHSSRVFVGMRPAEVLAAIERLFHVCGIAQATAASHALAAARGREHTLDVRTAHAALVRFEIAREHLWRVLIDWTQFTGVPAPSAAMAVLREVIPLASAALFYGNPFVTEPKASLRREAVDAVLDRFDAMLEARVLGMPPARWLELKTVEDLDRHSAPGRGAAAALIAHLKKQRWQSAGAAAPHYLPTLPSAELAEILDDEEADRFVECPRWQGDACETSPLARQHDADLVAAVLRAYGPGLYARAVAAVRELAATSASVRALLEGSVISSVVAERTAPGAAVAQVEAARGRLVHRVRLEEDRVAAYRIVAPTEWNFHPQGAALRGLSAAAAAAAPDLEDQAALLVTLLDPCVGYSLEVH